MSHAFYQRLQKLFEPNGRFATAIRQHLLRSGVESLLSFTQARDACQYPAEEPPHTRAAELIDEHVISQLPQPLFFTRDELLDALQAQLGGTNITSGFENAWNRVLASIVGSVVGLHDESTGFDLGTWGAPDRESAAEDDEPHVGYLWVSECEHFLLDAEWNEGKAEARLHGSITRRAMTVAVGQLSDACQMAANTLRFARSCKDETASFSRLVDATGTLLFRACLGALFRHSKSKMTELERSRHNAVQLLVESDKTTNDAVSVALSVTAIDALLCDGTAIAEQFSQRGAVLLETERHKRSGAREQLKKLYNERSRILHGDNVAST
jgi:Apea-like HEPN